MLALCARKTPTADRLTSISVCDSNTCLICGSEVGNHQHLLFQCEFGMQPPHELKVWMQMHINVNDLERLICWTNGSIKSKF